jgi:hypothetical protein
MPVGLFPNGDLEALPGNCPGPKTAVLLTLKHGQNPWMPVTPQIQRNHVLLKSGV